MCVYTVYTYIYIYIILYRIYTLCTVNFTLKILRDLKFNSLKCAGYSIDVIALYIFHKKYPSMLITLIFNSIALVFWFIRNNSLKT